MAQQRDKSPRAQVSSPGQLPGSQHGSFGQEVGWWPPGWRAPRLPGTKSAQCLLGTRRPMPLSRNQKGVGGIHNGVARVGAGRCLCRCGPCQSAAPRSHRQDSARPEAGPCCLQCRQGSAPAAPQGEAGAVRSHLPPSTSSAVRPGHRTMKLVMQHRKKAALQDTRVVLLRVWGAGAAAGHLQHPVALSCLPQPGHFPSNLPQGKSAGQHPWGGEVVTEATKEAP